MSSGAKKKNSEERLDEAARELLRIEQSIPAFIENARFVAGKSGSRALIVLASNPGMVDRRGFIMRWLVPARHGASRIRLDPYGAFVASRINGRTSSSDIIKAFQDEFKREPDETKEACLLFLRAMAKRGAICMVEKGR